MSAPASTKRWCEHGHVLGCVDVPQLRRLARTRGPSGSSSCRSPRRRAAPARVASRSAERAAHDRQPTSLWAPYSPRDRRHVAVEPLDLVEAADLVEEHVDDDVAVVDQHPLLLALALDPQRRPSGGLADAGLDVVDERAHEPAVGGVDDDEVVGDAEHAAHVEDDDVAALLLVGPARRRDGEAQRVGVGGHVAQPVVSPSLHGRSPSWRSPRSVSSRSR